MAYRNSIFTISLSKRFPAHIGGLKPTLAIRATEMGSHEKHELSTLDNTDLSTALSSEQAKGIGERNIL
jgi:hypothetical protein